jgi:hypothetical protein
MEKYMLAYDYPILGLFWTMLIFFLWIAWIMLLFKVIIDIFQSDMKGVAKAGWAIFVIIIPWLGVLIYLIANGDHMAQRNADAIKQNDEAMKAYIRDAAGGAGVADELAKLSDLHAKGVLTDEEFAAQKAKLIST